MRRTAVLLLSLILSVFSAFSQNVRSSQTISDRSITCIAEDSEGYIWIGTRNGLNRYNGMEFLIFLENSHITAIDIDSQGRIWAGTPDGINIIDGNGAVTTPESIRLSSVTEIRELSENYMLVASGMKLSKVNISSLLEEERYAKSVTCFEVGDNKEILAVILDGGRQTVRVLSSNLDELQMVEGPADEKIKGSIKNDNGSIWFYSNDHIFSLNPAKRKLSGESLTQDGNIQFVTRFKPGYLLVGITDRGLFSYDIWSGKTERVVRNETLSDKSAIALVDANHSIWITNREDVMHIYDDNNIVTPIYHFLDKLPSTELSSLAMDKEGFLWIIAGNDLISLKPADEVLVTILDRKSYSDLYLDNKDRLWIKENGTELKCYATSGGKLSSELKSFKFSEPFTNISEDSDGTIWIQFSNKLAFLSEVGVFTYVQMPEGVNFRDLITCDGTGELFVTTNSSLYRIDDKHEFSPLLSSNLERPVSIARDPEQGDYWIGTNNGLVRFSEADNVITRFKSEDGIQNIPVTATLVGNDGNLWIATEHDIIRYESSTETFSHYIDRRFSSNCHFTSGCSIKSGQGSLFFGSSEGIYSINPESIPEKYDRSFDLNSIKINGSTFVNPVQGTTFKHNQNTLNFWCSTSDPAKGYNIEYRFFLEGFDDGWSSAVRDGWMLYQNLPAGEYVFHAQVRNIDGSWSDNTVDFTFKIKPHPLLSSFALLIYALIGAALVAFLVWLLLHLRLRSERLKFATQRETMAKQHIDYLTDMSHELKLPLTLIYAPVQELSKSENLSERETDLLNLIGHNVDRMKALTEQMLDSGKYEEEKNDLKVAPYDVVQLIKMIANNYRFVAIDKGIDLCVNTPDKMDCWLDFEKVVKILNNLVSNAIKYTPEGGKVSIECESLASEGRLLIRVRDNGIGIPEDKRQSLFERFERLDHGSDVEGSGVGLNFAQRLAKIHKGAISYEAEEPCGSCFTLTIPVVKAAFSDDEIINLTVQSLSSDVMLHESESQEVKDKSVLIAEDDYELMMYLENLFSSEWNVIGVNNGLEAMDNIRQVVPDLVITDVSMPGKDGFELCREIKEGESLTHIPVIMLTALTDVQSSIAGLNSGADAYITKPFDPYYLLAEAKSLVRSRKNIQSKISNLTSSTIESDDELTSLKDADKEFITKLHTIIDEHMSEEGFNASALAKEMNNSYSNFFIKLKALTGQGPQVYINNYKMNVAMELLKSGKYNVGEVAFKTGFSAISNFSRSFKKQFGYSPSEVHQ